MALVTLQRGVDFLGYHISTTIKVKLETKDWVLKLWAPGIMEGVKKNSGVLWEGCTDTPAGARAYNTADLTMRGAHQT